MSGWFMLGFIISCLSALIASGYADSANRHIRDNGNTFMGLFVGSAAVFLIAALAMH